MLSNSSLDKILEGVAGHKWRFAMPSFHFKDIQNEVLHKGELVNIIDRSIIIVGDGVNPVFRLGGFGYSGVEVLPDDTPEIQATKIWIQLFGQTSLYDVIRCLIPEEVYTLFKKNKPSAFSFILGEDIPPESPLFQFMQTAPNATGLELRNINHGNLSNDPDGKEIKIMDIQLHEFQKHGHKYLFSKGGEPPISSAAVYEVFVKVRAVGKDIKQGIIEDQEDGNPSPVTKNANMRICFIWRIA